MAYNLKSLATNDQITGTAAGSTDTLYTATNVIGQIDMATAYNSHTSAVDLYVYILTSAQTASTVDPIKKWTIANGDTAILSELIGHKVPEDGTIEAYAGTTNVIRVTISGGEQI